MSRTSPRKPRPPGGGQRVRIPTVNQIESNPYFVNDYGRLLGRGIAVEAWSPLAQGAVFDDPQLTRWRQVGRTVSQVVLVDSAARHRVLSRLIRPGCERTSTFRFRLTDEQMTEISLHTGTVRSDRMCSTGAGERARTASTPVGGRRAPGKWRSRDVAGRRGPRVCPCPPLMRRVYPTARHGQPTTPSGLVRGGKSGGCVRTFGSSGVLPDRFDRNCGGIVRPGVGTEDRRRLAYPRSARCRTGPHRTGYRTV